MNIIVKNGIRAQCTIAMEECAELIQAISKCVRYETGDEFIPEERRENLIEEMADVLICMDQLKIMFSIDQEEIEKIKIEKKERIAKRYL